MTHNPTHPAGGAGAVEAAVRRAKYLLNRIENDDGIGIGEFDTMLRMVVALSPTPPVPEPEAEGEAVAWIQREVLAELGRHKDATATVASGLLKKPFGNPVALYTRPSSEAEIADLRANLAAAEQLAYDLKYAAAGGEDVPGSANAVTVADVDRWRNEAEARERAAEAKLDRMRQALDSRATEISIAVQALDRIGMGTRDSELVAQRAISDMASNRQALTLAGEEKTEASDV